MTDGEDNLRSAGLPRLYHSGDWSACRPRRNYRASL